MTDIPQIKEQLLREIDKLTANQQTELLDFARRLSQHREPGILTREELMQFVGTIPADDLALMEQAIEAECERIDSASWEFRLPD